MAIKVLSEKRRAWIISKTMIAAVLVLLGLILCVAHSFFGWQGIAVGIIGIVLALAMLSLVAFICLTASED